MRRFFAVLVCAALVACDDTGPSAPSGSLAGTWSGTITSNVTGNGALTLRLDHNGQLVSGNWRAVYSNGGVELPGTLSGSQTGSVVSIFLQPEVTTQCAPPGGAVAGTLAATLTWDGARLSGTYVRFLCVSAETGTIDTTRTQ